MPRKTQPKPALGGISLFGEGALRDLSAADVRNATAIINAVLRGDVDSGSQKVPRALELPGRFAEARRAKAVAKQAEKEAEERKVAAAEKEEENPNAKEIEKEEVFAEDETGEEEAVVEGKVKQMESNDAITHVPTRQMSDVEFETWLASLE
ncbi:hypothetical protein K4K57_006504 [Colletotrichum sp. SAR 10_99]|nr:hypothetical protein K4K55_003663 [Colletotrichum sp. SAR 10_96]KAI8259974.1 hypothetical protein K4K56_006575 [Colletotrichum sp. SAR 10_98]KAJ5010905.1 hypothetical protein K4K57_006504 [Colletotrichum sp. SAR 10_99]